MNWTQKTLFICSFLLIAILALSNASAYTYNWDYGPWGSSSTGNTYQQTSTISESSSTTTSNRNSYQQTTYQKTETSTVEQKTTPKTRNYQNDYSNNYDNNYNRNYNSGNNQNYYTSYSDNSYYNSNDYFKPSTVYVYSPSDYGRSYSAYQPDYKHTWQYDCNGPSGRCYYSTYSYENVPPSNWRNSEAYHWVDYQHQGQETYTDSYYYQPKYDWHLGYYNWNY